MKYPENGASQQHGYIVIAIPIPPSISWELCEKYEEISYFQAEETRTNAEFLQGSWTQHLRLFTKQHELLSGNKVFEKGFQDKAAV